MTHVTPRRGYVALPGYDAVARRLNLTNNDVEAAWSTLDLFPEESLGEFLDLPIRAVLGPEAPAQKHQDVLVLALMAAMIAVEADREKHRTIEREVVKEVEVEREYERKGESIQF